MFKDFYYLKMYLMKVIIEITLKILVLLSILDTTNSQKKNINVTMSTNTNDLSFVNKIMNVLDNQCYNISFNSNNYQNFTYLNYKLLYLI